MKMKAKENFESNLDNILLDNSTNPKTYWKIMKMLIKSKKGSNCILFCFHFHIIDLVPLFFYILKYHFPKFENIFSQAIA
jgi:hypothetical protein